VELQGENRALTSLLAMINNIVEGIAFTLVLFEERLEDILLLLPEQSRLSVRKLTFHALFAVPEGRDLARELVKAIVNHNIVRGSNVETVAEALRRKCGSFCSSDDVVIFKAQENLKKAADVGANAERGRILLNDSLRLFEQVAKSLSSEHLTAAIDKYIELQFYAGMLTRMEWGTFTNAPRRYTARTQSGSGVGSRKQSPILDKGRPTSLRCTRALLREADRMLWTRLQGHRGGGHGV
jgi:nuclear pore complex protein Nup155